MRQQETKYTNFKRLATNRANNAIRYIRLIGNLSNRHNYSYSETEVRAIFGALEDVLRLSKARFSVVLSRNKKIKL